MDLHPGPDIDVPTDSRQEIAKCVITLPRKLHHRRRRPVKESAAEAPVDTVEVVSRLCINARDHELIHWMQRDLTHTFLRGVNITDDVKEPEIDKGMLREWKIQFNGSADEGGFGVDDNQIVGGVLDFIARDGNPEFDASGLLPE